jgi:protein-tyrosine phosphatase
MTFSSLVTPLPLGLAGKIYRSVMPFSHYDPLQVVYQRYKELEITVVVLLSSDAECWLRAQRDLRQFYQRDGIKVIYMPVKDMEALDFEQLSAAVESSYLEALDAKNIAVHCFAGCGRTGMFTACLTGRVLGLSGEAAIDWVRNYFSCAVESDGQEEAVIQYCFQKGYGR